MKISNTSNRLKEYMAINNMRQVDILNLCKPYCDKYNVAMPKNVLSQYINGRNEPKQDKLTILGLALNVSEVWLMGYDVPMERDAKVAPASSDKTASANTDIFSYENIYPIKTKKFPLLGEIACGKPIFADEEFGTFIEASDSIKADFCLKAKGDSMINARIYDGDVVFIREQPMVENGEVAAVIINDEATLKRVYYYKNESKLVLSAENPKYPPFVYTNEELNSIRILGKAVAFMSLV